MTFLFTLHLHCWVNWFFCWTYNCVITLLKSPSWLHQFVLTEVENYIFKTIIRLQKLWKIRSEPFKSILFNKQHSFKNGQDNCKCLKVWQIHVLHIYLIFVYIYWGTVIKINMQNYWTSFLRLEHLNKPCLFRFYFWFFKYVTFTVREKCLLLKSYNWNWV